METASVGDARSVHLFPLARQRVYSSPFASVGQGSCHLRLLTFGIFDNNFPLRYSEHGSGCDCTSWIEPHRPSIHVALCPLSWTAVQNRASSRPSNLRGSVDDVKLGVSSSFTLCCWTGLGCSRFCHALCLFRPQSVLISTTANRQLFPVDTDTHRWHRSMETMTGIVNMTHLQIDTAPLHIWRFTFWDTCHLGLSPVVIHGDDRVLALLSIVHISVFVSGRVGSATTRRTGHVVFHSQQPLGGGSFYRLW